MKRRSAIIKTSDGRMMDSAGNRPAPRGLVAAAAVETICMARATSLWRPSGCTTAAHFLPRSALFKVTCDIQRKVSQYAIRAGAFEREHGFHHGLVVI